MERISRLSYLTIVKYVTRKISNLTTIGMWNMMTWTALSIFVIIFKHVQRSISTTLHLSHFLPLSHFHPFYLSLSHFHTLYLSSLSLSHSLSFSLSLILTLYIFLSHTLTFSTSYLRLMMSDLIDSIYSAIGREASSVWISNSSN